MDAGFYFNTTPSLLAMKCRQANKEVIIQKLNKIRNVAISGQEEVEDEIARQYFLIIEDLVDDAIGG